MRVVLKMLKNRTRQLAIAGVGLIVGLLFSAGAAVHAAIPDADGTIRSCPITLTQSVRIIDSATQSCNVLTETAVDWNQSSSIAFARIYWTSNGYELDASRSKNIVSMTTIRDGEMPCFTVAFAPRSAQITASGARTFSPPTAFVKDANGWVHANPGCEDPANAALESYENPGTYFITFYR